MDLLIETLDKDFIVIKPVIAGERNVESVIARAKVAILETPGKNVELDLTAVNFLDCIKIGTIIGTYHFLEFSGRKIHILVNDLEVKKALQSLSFNNIEIHHEDRLVLAGIA